MKKLFFEKPFLPFFITGCVTFVLASFFRVYRPDSEFAITLVNKDLNISKFGIWFIFSIYLFVLSAIYFLTTLKRMKTQRWLVICHYLFIVLFLILFGFLIAFGSSGTSKLVSGLPFLAVITAYAIIFIIDFILFVAGLIMLAVNLLVLKRK